MVQINDHGNWSNRGLSIDHGGALSDLIKGIRAIGPTVKPKYLYMAGYLDLGYSPTQVNRIIEQNSLCWEMDTVEEIECKTSESGVRKYYFEDEDGEEMSFYSVTTILKKVEPVFFPKGYTDALTLGNYVHYRVQADLAHDAGHPGPPFDIELPLPDARAQEYETILHSWQLFKYYTKVKLAPQPNIEVPVYDTTLKYAGRADLIIDLDMGSIKSSFPLIGEHFKLISTPYNTDKFGPGRFLVDIKTGRHYDSHDAQVAAYWHAYTQLYPEANVTRAGVLRLIGDTWIFREVNLLKGLYEWVHACTVMEKDRIEAIKTQDQLVGLDDSILAAEKSRKSRKRLSI